MGIVIKHNISPKVVISRKANCLAKPIKDILSSTSWKDRRCFIIAGGPSLIDFDFSTIKDELVIGVNKSFIKFPATINYGMDMGFYDKITNSNSTDVRLVQLHQQWLAYRGVKVFLMRPNFKLDPSVYVVNNIKEKTLSFDFDKGIYGANNSGWGALALAIVLGATKIGLLGYDMKVDNVAKRTHWHKGYINQRFDSMQSKLDKFKKPFEELAPVIVDAGIKVVNLNKNSGLDCFPKDSLKNFLQNYSK